MYETVALFLLHRILLSFWNSDSSASVFSRLNLRNVRDQQNLLVPGGLHFFNAASADADIRFVLRGAFFPFNASRMIFVL